MSVKKMDQVPEKKTESKILAKMGKKEQGRCQKESVVLKNGQWKARNRACAED